MEFIATTKRVSLAVNRFESITFGSDTTPALKHILKKNPSEEYLQEIVEKGHKITWNEQTYYKFKQVKENTSPRTHKRWLSWLK